MKLVLGTEVGLGPGDIVLDGAQLFVPQRGIAPNFRPMSVVAKRLECWMDQYATRYNNN